MLRSVGQTNRGFNKMILFESLFLCVKACFYGFIISFLLIYTIIQIFSLDYSDNKIKISIPYIHIIVCAFVVFFIIFLTMRYATKQLKNNNILDDLKKDYI